MWVTQRAGWLARMAGLVWLFVFWLLSLSTLVYGGALLLRHAA